MDISPLLDDAERALIEGSFRRALQLANKVLDQIPPPRGDPGGESPKGTSCCSCLSLPEDCFFAAEISKDYFDSSSSSKHFDLDWTKSAVSDPFDRAAAVALQSWFELSQLPERPTSSNNTPTKQQPEKHLRPFVQHYYGSSPTVALSLDLLLVLIRFCQATGHFAEALQLSSQALRRRQAAACQQQHTSHQENLQELFDILWLNLLPYCVEATRMEVKHFKQQGTTPTEEEEAEEWIVGAAQESWTPEPQRDALVLLLEEMDPTSIIHNDDDNNNNNNNMHNTPQPEWLVQSLQRCYAVWKSQLAELQVQEDEEAMSLTPCSSNLTSITRKRPLLWKARMRLILQEWIHRAVSLVVQRGVKSDNKNGIVSDRSRAAAAALVVAATTWISLWLLARRYHVVRRTGVLLRSQTSALLQTILWKPVKEIVEAILPSGSSS